MSKISILHYASPPIVGGVEHTIYHHARLLKERRYNVRIITGRGDQFIDGIPVIKISLINSRNPEVESVTAELNSGRVTDRFKTVRDRLIDQLMIALADTQVCIVHNILTLHKNLPLTAALRVISDQFGTKIISWSHDFAWRDQLYASDMHPGYPWNLLNEQWEGVKYVVVSGHRRSMLAELLKIPESQIEVVSPGVDIPHFFRLTKGTELISKKVDLFNYDPLILLPARITRRKNIQFALRVISELKVEKPSACLLITGPPGPHNPKNIAYLEKLQNLVKDLQISSNVIFLYALGNEDEPLIINDQTIADFYQIADILLFPSLREGFGIPILEAGITRMPVFASNIPPFIESSGGNINLFDPKGKPRLVANAIIKYLRMDPVYKLKRRVYQEYTWNAIIDKRVIPLIESV